MIYITLQQTELKESFSLDMSMDIHSISPIDGIDNKFKRYLSSVIFRSVSFVFLFAIPKV